MEEIVEYGKLWTCKSCLLINNMFNRKSDINMSKNGKIWGLLIY